MKDSLIFLSLGNDRATKSQKLFTDVQLNYFMNILKEILETETRQITRTNAYRLRGTIHQKDAEVKHSYFISLSDYILKIRDKICMKVCHIWS